jgi:hypothetical protein
VNPTEDRSLSTILAEMRQRNQQLDPTTVTPARNEPSHKGTPELAEVVPLAARRNSTEVMRRLFEEALAIESEDARRAGSIGFLGRVLVQATLPYREPRDNPPAWGRRNGNVALVIQPGYTIRERTAPGKDGRVITQQVPCSLGYPYGNIPRLVLAWLSTEAVRTQERKVVLGRSLREFMEGIGLDSITGGKNGSITRLREQLGRLFASTIAVVRDETLAGQNIQSMHTAGFRVTDQASVWWDPQRPEQAGLFQSEVTLSERFFQELTDKPVPVDLRVLRALKQSPIALDIYCWLTWRNSFLRTKTTVPWEGLMGQFGSESSPKKFRENFKKALQQVLVVYSVARVDVSPSGLVLLPSPTSVAKVPAVIRSPR